MNVIFDMETGDPDDLITLLLLLSNKDVEIKAITCYQGSPTQIGLIQHVLNLANKNIPIAGWNTPTPSELSPYYLKTVGNWESVNSKLSPTKLLNKTILENPEVHVLTGAPLTNIAMTLKEFPNLKIQNMTTQGGYLGNLVPNDLILEKFKNKPYIRTYNLTNDVEAFTTVNYSKQIDKLTYVTKDLCHGFLYDNEIHKTISFGDNNVQQLLKKCLEYYALSEKSKAMHDRF